MEGAPTVTIAMIDDHGLVVAGERIDAAAAACARSPREPSGAVSGRTRGRPGGAAGRAAGHGGRPRRPPVPGPTTAVPSAPLAPAVRDLLADAGRGLGRAVCAVDVADRYAAAHLAALRAAAALIAARARPTRGRRGSVWQLLPTVAPDLAEWAAYFAAGSAKRQAAQAGISRLIPAREADDIVRQASAFLGLVERELAQDGDDG